MAVLTGDELWGKNSVIAVWASNREAARLTKKVHSAFQAHQVSAAKLYVFWVVNSSGL